ncbi:MAG: diacylglycerol kinase [Flavobacteriales bacterium]|nr:diacylglycerol kinase [Flavobacteriales bacterium]|tara:strand:- start:821 stop:1192 length:372 start_codon:yes stop_codon:yes gene_type:complete
MSKQNFSVKQRIKSFNFAFQGLRTLLAEEHNSRIHLLATMIVLIAGFYFDIGQAEWLVLIITIAIVFICEILNTAMENIADFISPDIHPSIKKIKDLAAAAVLISAIMSVVVGLIIFLPKLGF